MRKSSAIAIRGRFERFACLPNNGGIFLPNRILCLKVLEGPQREIFLSYEARVYARRTSRRDRDHRREVRRA